MGKEFKDFEDFWPFYLGEHSNPLNRKLHFVGTFGAIALIISALISTRWWLLLAALGCGYGFAWIGHFVIEKNRPATFKHPLWSLRGDFRLFNRMLFSFFHH